MADDREERRCHGDSSVRHALDEMLKRAEPALQLSGTTDTPLTPRKSSSNVATNPGA